MEDYKLSSISNYSNNNEKCMLIIDPEAYSEQFPFKKVSNSWHNKFLYFGLEGAKAWYSVSEDPVYSDPQREDKIIDVFNNLLKDLHSKIFISLGPGNAKLDLELIKILKRRNKTIKYIPVDISDALLFWAIVTISSEVNVPFGILTDIEERLYFIKNKIFEISLRPKIFTLIGNTLGNLQINEKTFLDELSSVMEIDDFFLLNVSTITKQWKLFLDPRMKYENYTNSIKFFLTRGISIHTGESTKWLIKNFTKVVGFRHNKRINNNISEVIEIYDKRNDRLITRISRYLFENLVNWINERKDFQIIFSHQLIENNVIGDGFLLIKKLK